MVDQSPSHLFQINTSDGGVPKLPVQKVKVNSLGAEGDRQGHPTIHGGSDRALCLYSLERILALQREGHPIIPGSTGENLTIVGLDWDRVRPGIQLAIGQVLEIEVTAYTEPCSQIADFFSNRAIERILQIRNPGWSRVYAKVLTPGEITVGDRVFLREPGRKRP